MENGTIVREGGVRNRTEQGGQFSLVTDDRLVGQVAAGHHQRIEVLEQQVMEWRVRQEDADGIGIRGNFPNQTTGGQVAGQQDDGAGHAQQFCFLGFIDLAEFLHRGDVTDHDGERLVRAMLAASEPRDRFRTRGVTG